MILIRLSLSLFSLLTLAPGATAAPIVPSPDRETFAKNNPTREGVPVEAFQFGESLPKDLQIEVWATTPQVYSPVAMDVDAQGRVWCTEGIDYGLKPSVETGQSIMVLEDKDHDGKADSSHVFVTEKGMRPAPLGIAVFDNKIVLSATPSIIIYTDVNRNAVFDQGVDYSFHAGSIDVKVFGGQTRKVLFRKSGLNIEFLKDHSWMSPASEMGLSDQDLADLVTYLKTL